MADPNHVAILSQGNTAWNAWRVANPSIRPDLSDLKFSNFFRGEDFYDMANFVGFNFQGSNLDRIEAGNCYFKECNFSNSEINFSYLCFSIFDNCDFSSLSMRVTKIGSASFISCNFIDSDLSYCSAEETSFSGSKIISSNLSHVSMVKTDLSNVKISSVRVYGASVWDINLDNCHQEEILIEESGNSISIPNIKLAQFISLLLNNEEIRDAIDAITSKSVLILGRFTPERKAVLDQIKSTLKTKGYIPILFDFDGPTSRDVTETVITLASLSRFVIADITSPKSIPQELTSIIPNFPSIPIQPILKETEREYGMFEHFKNYPWVLEEIRYSGNQVSINLLEAAITNCNNYIENR